MIFVMSGSASHQFIRLLEVMDEMAPRLGEPVIMQCGRQTYPGRHTECFGYSTFMHVHSLLRECRVLVGQGSAGAVLMSRQYGKPLVLVPRDHKRGEILDQHQLETARSVEGTSRMIEVVTDVAGLEAAVRRAQAKADAGLTYESSSERERLLTALRAAVEGREMPTP